MSTINKLSFRLKYGLLTELYSDTLFGHFCWRMVEECGSEKLTEFLEFYKNRDPVFTLTDAMPQNPAGEILFPVPLLPIVTQENVSKSKQDKIREFLAHKEKKSVKYIYLQELNDLLKTGRFTESEEKSSDRKKEKPFKESLRTGIAIDRANYASAQGKLFTIAPRYLSSSYSLVVLLKVINKKLFDEFHCDLIWKSVFTVGFGKKKSSGYGAFDDFKIEDYEGIKESETGDRFITLSNYLPSKEDGLTDWNYDLLLKYGKMGEERAASANPFKKPVLFFRSGSTFSTTNKNDSGFFGRCAENISSQYADAIQYGYAFSLKMK